MTVEYSDGDIFDCHAECLVNPVNTVGVMGKGLALQFKRRWPDNFEVYKDLCDHKLLKLGEVHMFMTEQDDPSWVCNFPTKGHWRDSSKIEDIDAGLENLIDMLKMFDVGIVAIPALGCGLGGLSFDVVSTSIERVFGESSIKAIVFPPKETLR